MAINFLNNIDLNKNQIIEPVIHNETSAPGSPSGGQIYYNSTDGNLYVYDDVGTAWVDLTSQGAGSTNLGYTSSATNGIVTSSTGTDATIILVTPSTGTNLAGLMSPADKTKLDGIETGAQVNVGTNIAQGTRTTTTVPVTSSTGTDATLQAATTSLAGVMTSADKTKLDGIAAGAEVNVVDSVDETTPGTSTGTPIVVDPTTGNVLIKSMAYAGTTNVGHVPTGGSATTFLRGDGTWVTPTDNNTITNAFTTHTVTDTDSGYTWAETGSAVADSTADTLTLVSGTAIDIDVDATNDAIRIAHADTSAISGTLGTSGIQDITIDGNGHVTAVTTATYNNYSHPNHTGHVTSTGDGATVLTVSAITGQTPLTSGLVSTDEFVINDGGVIKRMDVSVLETYMQNNLAFSNNSGTVTGTGTAGTLTVWSTGGAGIEDSIVSQSGGTLFIAGNLDVSGLTTTIDSTTVAIGDNMMKYAKDNTSNVSDIGWYGVINDGTEKYSGMWYDASTGTTTPKFVLGIATTEPAGTGTIATPGVLVADLEGNADTADKWSTARTVTYATGDVTGSFSIDGSANVSNVALTIANDSVTNGKLGNMAQSTIKGRAAGAGTGDPQDLTAAQVRTIINVADGADDYGGWNLQVNGTNTTGGAEVASAETVNFTGNTASSSVVGVTISNPSANVVNVAVGNATTSVRGGVALATNANTINGTQTNTAVTPDGLAATKVVSSITIASLLTGVAEINHALGTEDVSVELYDGSTGDTVYADVTRGDIGGLNTTNYVTIGFGVVPAAITTVDVVIHSHKGATSVSPAYS